MYALNETIAGTLGWYARCPICDRACLKDIKQEAAVNKVWEDYIAENYVRDEEHFGGMDANSERDPMKRKD